MLNRPRETKLVLNRKNQSMTYVDRFVSSVNSTVDMNNCQNKNAGSGGDGEDDEE
jgi:hypothetical protein